MTDIKDQIRIRNAAPHGLTPSVDRTLLTAAAARIAELEAAYDSTLYVWAVQQGMPEGLTTDEQRVWLHQYAESRRNAMAGRQRAKEANDRLAERVKELEAIVAKLPKDKNGTIVWPHETPVRHPDEKGCGYVGEEWGQAAFYHGAGDYTYQLLSECEAAEAAEEKPGRCPSANDHGDQCVRPAGHAGQHTCLEETL